MVCLPATEADMADSNAVAINEMFRRLRSAELSDVADAFIFNTIPTSSSVNIRLN